MAKFRLTPNVKRHVQMVARTAVCIAKAFPKGSVDVNLVERSALLHDLDKIATLKDKKHHGDLTLNFLTMKGFPEVGRIADNAGIMHHARLKSWEEKIVGLSDKRVLEDKVVLLEDRLVYISKKYGTGKNPAGRKAMNAYRKLERNVFRQVNFSPEELAAKVRKTKPIRL